MIDASYNSFLYPQSEQRAFGSKAFSVPKSPLRAENVEINRRLAGDRSVADSMELSGARPDLLGLPRQAPLPIFESERNAFPGLNDPARSPNRERRRAADRGNVEPHEKSDDFDAEDGEDGKPGEATDAKGRPLDERQQREVSGLKNRDREVRQHEQAHKAVGGSYAGAISYDYQQGPDGRRYAVGGEVSIDVSEEKDPAATAAKMRQVRAAALAPAEPSGQDLQVAAEASRIESEARQEMSGERMEKARGGDSGRTGEPGAAPGAGASDGEDGENAADSTPGIGMASANRTTGDSGIGSPPPTKLSSPYAGLGIPAGSRVGSIRSFSRRAIDVFA